MSGDAGMNSCEHADLVCAYALQTLTPSEVPAVQAHLAVCTQCREDFEALRPTVDEFVWWPVDVLRPTTALWERVTQRVSAETGQAPATPVATQWTEPEWQQVASGISCKVLSRDTARHRVSMLVRLAPGAEYPAHTHADVEELHLLDGELWIEDRLLHPGDYNRAEPGTGDTRVWSETGCTCVLITSTRDVLT